MPLSWFVVSAGSKRSMPRQVARVSRAWVWLGRFLWESLPRIKLFVIIFPFTVFMSRVSFLSSRRLTLWQRHARRFSETAPCLAVSP